MWMVERNHLKKVRLGWDLYQAGGKGQGLGFSCMWGVITQNIGEEVRQVPCTGTCSMPDDIEIISILACLGLLTPGEPF